MTILQAVLAKPEGEREDYLQQACEGDHSLLVEAREKRYPETSQLFRRAIGIAEKAHDPIIASVWYNFACAAAIAGYRDEAFRYLKEAVDSGWIYVDAMSADKDLTSLHADFRFAPILEEAGRRAAASRPNVK